MSLKAFFDPKTVYADDCKEVLAVALLAGIGTLAIGELFDLQALLTLTSALVVLSSLLLSASLTSRIIGKKLQSL